MRGSVALGAAVLLVAVAAPGAARRGDDPLAGRVAGAVRQCAGYAPQDSLTIAGPASVMTGRTAHRIWVAPVADCPALRRDDVLIVDHRAGGSGYCEGDRVQSLPRDGIIAGPFCRLGRFTAYDRPR